MRAYITSAVIVAGLFATSGAFAADIIAAPSVDWAQWGEWLREAAGSIPG
ncbi:hypothetical protein [Herbaspirillum robiniae]|nr:hypothetical protein [Herbaspirillum robiniae]